MAEFVFRAIGAVIEAFLHALIARTGRRVLSLLGLKSNLFFEVLIGLVVWAIIGIVLMVFFAVFFGNP